MPAASLPHQLTGPRGRVGESRGNLRGPTGAVEFSRVAASKVVVRWTPAGQETILDYCQEGAQWEPFGCSTPPQEGLAVRVLTDPGQALLHFLRKRTPHLHTDREQAPTSAPPPFAGCYEASRSPGPPSRSAGSCTISFGATPRLPRSQRKGFGVRGPAPRLSCDRCSEPLVATQAWSWSRGTGCMGAFCHERFRDG